MSTDLNDDMGAIAEYRREFRMYLESLEWADEWRSAAFDTTEDSLAFDAQVLGRLHEAGWTRYGWPSDAGGLGGSEIYRAVYYEELSYAMLPIPSQHWTLEVVGPTLLKFARDLATQYLPRYMSGVEWWGLSFAESESGSNLATLDARAVDDAAGDLVISGRKIWNNPGATAAARLLVLARTGAPDSPLGDLTMVVVDADTPGVTVRPIMMASGRRDLAEVCLDDVRVAAHQIVGGIGGGRRVASDVTQNEVGMYRFASLTKAFTRLSKLRTDMMEHRASAVYRERFARTFLAVVAASARCALTVQKLASGEAVGPESSIDKLLMATTEKEVNDLILDVKRARILGDDAGANHNELDMIRAEWWRSWASTPVAVPAISSAALAPAGAARRVRK